MAKIRGRISTAYCVLAVIAVLLAVQGCRKAASVAPKVGPTRKTAVAEADQTAKDATERTAAVEQSKKAASSKPTVEKAPSAPKADVLPKADIDSHDSKYAEGKYPRIQADGKPVTLLYCPPTLFNINIAQGGQDKAVMTFGTITVGDDNGQRLAEVHIAARLISKDPAKSEYTRLAVLYTDRIKPGQTFTGSAAGMQFRIEVLGNGKWSDSIFEGSESGWIKLRITAE